MTETKRLSDAAKPAGTIESAASCAGAKYPHSQPPTPLNRPARAGAAGLPYAIAPSMGAILRVQVPPQVDHDERSEAQLHEGDRVWEGSVEHKL